MYFLKYCSSVVISSGSLIRIIETRFVSTFPSCLALLHYPGYALCLNILDTLYALMHSVKRFWSCASTRGTFRHLVWSFSFGCILIAHHLLTRKIWGYIVRNLPDFSLCESCLEKNTDVWNEYLTIFFFFEGCVEEFLEKKKNLFPAKISTSE